MTRVSNYRCDVCGVLKGETNHWFMAWLRQADKDDVVLVEVTRWKDSIAGQAWHFCGLECAMKHISKTLDNLPTTLEIEN